jgi:alpha-D-ribose 1-methylphosphonate 5-triphosphate synthase subunit PhnI
MYVAVKGGERAIEASWRLLDKERRGDPRLAELGVAQIREQLRLAVARVMTEGSVYDEELAALAIKQAAGDLVEAIFLLRAYRTTLPRFGYTEPLKTEAIHAVRRISATFKDVPGGQLLGPTYDYTQRLLDFALLADGDDAGGQAGSALREATRAQAAPAAPAAAESMPRVVALLNKEGLIEQESITPDAPEPGDLSREPLAFPASRTTRLQNLARGDEGFLLAMGYATQRGYAHSHPFAGEIRFGSVAVEMELDELGEAVEIGDIDITECQMINQFAGSSEAPPSFTQGYGLAFGHSERKAMAMALVDRALRAEELGETLRSPTQDVEFMLSHSDNVEASGFVQHLKLPHYVDFQSELELVRKLRAKHAAASAADEGNDHGDQRGSDSGTAHTAPGARPAAVPADGQPASPTRQAAQEQAA